MPCADPATLWRLLALVASALAIGTTACSQGPAPGASKGPGGGGPPPAAVAIVKVAPENVPVRFEYTGQIFGQREVEVRPRVSGIVLKRNFTEGSTVRRGQSLYSLDPAPLQAVLARAEADIEAADARLAQASAFVARLKPLAEQQVVSRRDFDDAVSAERVARADAKGARARRAEARLNLDYTRVESPIDGFIGRSQVSEGALASGPQTLLTTVTQVDPLKVRFGISDTDQMRWRADVASGALVLPAADAFDLELVASDGSTYPRKGRLRFADTRVSASAGTVEAEGEIANPDGSLKPGQFVRVRLLGATRPNAIKVPARAVLEGPQGRFVYLMIDGKALPQPVTVGEQMTDGWIIARGLKGGEDLIVDGMARIFFPGAPVVLAPAGDAGGPGAPGRPGAASPAAGDARK